MLGQVFGHTIPAIAMKCNAYNDCCKVVNSAMGKPIPILIAEIRIIPSDGKKISVTK